MTSESNKIIVKVGKKSNIKLSNSKVFRAITSQELVKTARKHDDCRIVVIENISTEEQKDIKEFALEFKNKNENNSVLFFIPDNDDITSGIADELDYNIYLTLGDLYKAIYDLYGINVSTFLSDKKKFNSLELQESMPDGMTDIFGGLDEALEDDMDKDIANVEIKEDIKVEESTAVEEIVLEEPVIDESKVIETSVEVVTTTIDNVVQKPKLEKVETETKVEEQINVNIETKVEETTNIDTSIENTPVIQTEGISEEASDIIDKLKMQLNDCKYDYNVLLKDMKSANSRIIELEELIRVLKDEKNEIVNRFNCLVDTQTILEDPISLVDYEKLKATIEELESKIKELNSAIENYKNIISDKNEEITGLENKLDKSDAHSNELKQSLDVLNSQIESGEIHEKVIEEYSGKLTEITLERDKIQSELDVITHNLGISEQKLSLETSNRLLIVEILKSAFTKIKDISDKLEIEEKLKEEHVNKINNLEKSVSEYKSKEKEQSAKIIELQEKEATIDKRIELANNYAEAEKAKLQTQINELTTKLNLTKQQLAQKESQYSQLVAASGMDAGGANVLVETNKTLENINKTLSEQLAASNSELERLKVKDNETVTSLKQYQAQCKQLSDMLKNVASSGAGAGAAVVNADALMKPVKYNGQSQIIPVFGSGSFGITTTAMSLAYKLYMTSNVLYIDFDIVAPKADAWFSKNPMRKLNNGMNTNDRRMSALGIFYEMGMNTFMANADYIIEKCDRTKGGGIDYLSGVYYKVDNFKLLTADYTALFNFLSTRYQYIIVDMGRLGSSDINDQLIKIISDIAYRNVVVTPCDWFETRNFKNKLIDSKIKLNNVAWLVNMCDTTNLDERIKSNIMPCDFGMVLRDTSMYGLREKLTRNKLNKDKFELFINSVLFTGRK